MEYYGVVLKGESLSHHGILGMKWGVRRFQNPDGTLTEEGKRRYAKIIIGNSKPQDNVFGPFRPRSAFNLKGKKRYEAGKMFDNATADDLISLHEKLLSEGYSKNQLRWLAGRISDKDHLKYLEYHESLDKKEGIPVFEEREYSKKELTDLYRKRHPEAEKFDFSGGVQDEFEIKRAFHWESPLYQKGYDIHFTNNGARIYNRKKIQDGMKANEAQIKKQVIDELASDISRWRGISPSSAKSIIRKEVNSLLNFNLDYTGWAFYPRFDKNGGVNSVSMPIGSFPSWNDGHPVEIDYDLNKKKITYLGPL